MQDLLLMNLPWCDLAVPPCAPAVLKGICESAGYSVITKDFNVDLFNNFCNKDRVQFEVIQEYFLSSKSLDKAPKQVHQIYDFIVEFVKNNPTRFVGISVFTALTQKSTLEILQRLRKESIEAKLVIGGRGAGVRPHLAVMPQLTSIERFLTFDKILTNRKLIDYAVIGDGEDAVIELLEGSLTPEDRNHRIPNKKDLEYPFSNFDNYDLDSYIGVGPKKQLPIITSKGCVRDCDFCDVRAHFKKFQSKTGKRMAEEMIYLSSRYKIYEFAANDSIINGNMKSLTEACMILKEHNEKAENKIMWAGNWICRPNKAIKAPFFELLAKSGCSSLTIGAEHGSNRVLAAMNKKTNVEGLYYDIEHLSQNGIQCILNNVIGHWSEEYEDFLEHIEMILRLGPYYANRTVTALMLGAGFGLLKGTPADVNEMLSSDDEWSSNWYSNKNPVLTLKVRIHRIYIIYQICLALRIPIITLHSFLYTILTRLEEQFEDSSKFYDEVVDTSLIKPCKTYQFINTYQEYVEERLRNLYPNTNMKLVLTARSCNGNPRIKIEHNGKVVFYEELSPGRHELDLELANDFQNENTLIIGMDNKGEFDTIVDSNGVIAEDKNVEIESLVLDKADVRNDYNFFFKKIEYWDNENLLDTSHGGFYSNSVIKIRYQAPFWRFFMMDNDQGAGWHMENKVDIQDILAKILSKANEFKF